MARGGTKTSVNEIDAAQKQRDALIMRIAGHSYQDIADALGYAHPSGSHKAVTSALRKTVKEPADELRDLEVSRMDHMYFCLEPKIAKGDARAIEVAIKILERRAKLLGLDAPIKINIEQIVNETAERHGLTESEKAELHIEVAKHLASTKATV